MKTVTRLRRFVDWDLGKTGGVHTGNFSLLIGMAIVGGPLAFLRLPYSTGEIAVVVSAASMGLAWFSFVGWRAGRLLKASSIRADRQYDRDGKYGLPSEYASTESATRARWRRKRRVRNTVGTGQLKH